MGYPAAYRNERARQLADRPSSRPGFQRPIRPGQPANDNKPWRGSPANDNRVKRFNPRQLGLGFQTAKQARDIRMFWNIGKLALRTTVPGFLAGMAVEWLFDRYWNIQQERQLGTFPANGWFRKFGPCSRTNDGSIFGPWKNQLSICAPLDQNGIPGIREAGNGWRMLLSTNQVLSNGSTRHIVYEDWEHPGPRVTPVPPPITTPDVPPYIEPVRPSPWAPPEIIPPLMPMPNPVPLPYRYLPYRNDGPNSERGPKPRPRARPLPRHRYARPGKGTKEKKFVMALHPRSFAAIALNGVTETKDWIDVFYDAIGSYDAKGNWVDFKGKYMGTTVTNYGQSIAGDSAVYMRGWNPTAMTPQQKAKAIYRHWDRLNVQKAVENAIYNQAEDRFFGQIGRQMGRASREAGFSQGWTVGPAM